MPSSATMDRESLLKLAESISATQVTQIQHFLLFVMNREMLMSLRWCFKTSEELWRTKNEVDKGYFLLVKQGGWYWLFNEKRRDINQGLTKGFVALMKELKRNVIFHCVIHQKVLCVNSFSERTHSGFELR